MCLSRKQHRDETQVAVKRRTCKDWTLCRGEGVWKVGWMGLARKDVKVGGVAHVAPRRSSSPHESQHLAVRKKLEVEEDVV